MLIAKSHFISQIHKPTHQMRDRKIFFSTHTTIYLMSLSLSRENLTICEFGLMFFGPRVYRFQWWRHQMKAFSALLALCAGNSPVTGEIPPQKPVTHSSDVFFDLRLNKRLSKHSKRRLFETHHAHYDVTIYARITFHTLSHLQVMYMCWCFVMSLEVYCD